MTADQFEPQTQRELLHALGRLPLPAPHTMRELFEAFSLYDAAGGLHSMLGRLDLSEVRPHEVYQLVHGRPPETVTHAIAGEGYDPAAHLAGALHSAEFRQNILGNLLRAFPEKARDVFLHVPKCAGTDLILNLGQRRLLLPKMLEIEGWVSTEDFFTALRQLMQAIPHYQRFFVYGHIQFGEYIAAAGVRPPDRIFTVLRDPLDLMISQANYAITRLRQDPLGDDPDTDEFLRFLDLPHLPVGLTLREWRELAFRALLNRRICPRNHICHFLGNGGKETYRAAMINIVNYDVEVTTTAHYRDWLRTRWDLAPTTRHNLSNHWLARSHVEDALPAQVLADMAESRKLYDVVWWALGRKGTPSITGTEIAAAAGPGLLDGFAEEIAAARLRPASVPARALRQRMPVRLFEGTEAIDHHSSLVPGDAAAQRLVFGIDANAAEFLDQGWAVGEEGFTWTTEAVSRIELPNPTDGADYRLRLVVGPFVVADRLQSQRVTVAANGIEIGSATVAARSLIDCDLPQAVLGIEPRLRIDFILPDAASPHDLVGSEDTRTLGLAFERLELLSEDFLGDQDVEAVELESTEAVTVAALTDAAEAQPEAAGGGPAEPVAEPEQDTELERPDLMTRFESLGENCEFGLVQRRCGADPLGLFRFSSAPIDKLLKALDAGFEGLGLPERLSVELSANGREYMISDHQFGFLYHAWVMAEDMSPEEVHQRETRRLPLLVRKLLQDLNTGEKIFVCHGMDSGLAPADVRRLATAIRRFGPNTLLWVALADGAHPPGSVDWDSPDLLKGYIDRFAPGQDAHDLSLNCWVTVCRGAYRLWRHRGTGRQTQGDAAAVRARKSRRPARAKGIAATRAAE